jgi:hypothetical protein
MTTEQLLILQQIGEQSAKDIVMTMILPAYLIGLAAGALVTWLWMTRYNASRRA